MLDISKQIKIDELREKFIIQLQKNIINNEKFHTIEILKILIKKINLKINNIIYDK